MSTHELQLAPPERRHRTAMFTGHRPQKLGGFDRDHPLNRAVRDAIADKVQESINGGITRFISGMAIGTDTWGAEAVIAARANGHDIELIAAIPFKGQEMRWPQHVQDHYHNILAECTEVHYCSHVQAGASRSHIVKALHARNTWMLERAAVVIAVWDGNDQGGTAHTMRYATAHHVHHINPTEL